MRRPRTINLYCAILWVAVFIHHVQCESIPCVHRDYGNGGTVCVCNATYCDTIEPLGIFPPRQYYLFTSSKDGQRFNKTKRNFGPESKTGVLITVNASITYQTILGFGGGLSDAAAINTYSISEEAKHNLISSYYSASGIEYNFIRTPMGGSDFSTRTYTYADSGPDPALKNFKLSKEDTDFKIPFILESLKLSERELKLLGVPWTAPPWMKTNGDYKGFGFLKEDYYESWSQYYIRFLEEYDKYGIKFWGLSTGNEPSDGLIPFFFFNCMAWTPFSQRQWIAENFGPALENSKFNDTVIIAVDDQRFQLPWWPQIIFENDKASKYVGGIGVHWYTDSFIPTTILDKTHNAFPEKFILPTEASFMKKFWEVLVDLGSWSNGEHYAESIIEDINHWCSGWIDWNLVLDVNGGPNWANNYCDAPIIVNKTADEFYKQPMYYALGHFSKFIPEGSMRIQVKIHASSIKGTGVKTPNNEVVLVLLNKKSNEVPVTIAGAPRGYANLILPAKSITTLIYRDKKFPSWYQ